MFAKVKSYFSRPHPLDSDWSTSVKRALGIGAIIIFILFVFAPFGLHHLEGSARFINALEFGAITAVVTFISSGILPRIFTGILNPEKWTFGKELLYTLFTILLIGFANAAFLYFMGYVQGTFWKMVLYFEAYTLAVGVIPVMIFLAIDHNKEQRIKQRRADSLNQELGTIKEDPERKTKLISIIGEGEKLEFEERSSSILYFSAEGNYVDIFHLSDEGMKRTTIRSTLKNVWSQLPNPPFYDCHRSYIVNMDHVSHISGNARNYELQLKELDLNIPVSRAKGAELKEEVEVLKA